MVPPLSEPLSSEPLQHRETRRARLQCAGAVLLVAVAAGDLLRWQAYPAAWTRFDILKPMSPALAGLFILIGTAFSLRVSFPGARWVRGVSLSLIALAAAGAVHALLCDLRGQEPPWENWAGFRELTVNGFTSGDLSAQASVLVLLSCLAWIGLLTSTDPRARIIQIGVLASLLVGLFAIVAVMSYAVGNPPLGNSSWLKVTPLAMAEFTLLHVTLLMGGRATNRLRHWFFGNELSNPYFAPISREERLVFNLLAVVGLVALVAGVAYLRFETKVHRARSMEALQIISDLKRKQIEEWRQERLRDARMVMRSPFLVRAAQAAVNSSLTHNERAELALWLKVWAENYGYTRAVLLSPSMERVTPEPGEAALAVPGLRERLRQLPPDTGVVELPPYVDAAGTLHWDLLVPLRTHEAASPGAVILLQTNPTRFIIPILQSWPAEHRTGQSVLWFREGDQLISLGGYRPAPDVTADELRPFGMIRKIPELPPQSLPARILRGEVEAGEGLDYRGVPIIGLGRRIPNSEWLFSSRVESSEVYAPLQRTAVSLASILAALIATTGLATSWLWRQRQSNLLHDRLAAELAQRRLEARLGLVMQHAKDIIMVTDENLRFVDVNQQAVDTYGWTREELLQMKISDIRAPETLNELPADLAQADSENGVIYETIGLRRDGTTFPIEVSFRRIDIEGRLHRLAIIRDITERKQAEASLRDSQERFAKAFQSNPSGIAISELASGRYIEVNASLCRKLGLSVGEIIGRTALELGIWPNGEARQRMQDSIMAGRPIRSQEMQARRRNGETMIALVSIERIELNGQACLLSLVEDITERREAELKLRDSQERFAKAFQSNPTGISIAEFESGRFIEVNESFCRILKCTPADIVGRTSVELGMWGSSEERLQVYQALAAGQPLRNREMQARTHSGETITALLSSELIELNGKPCILSLIEDITERKRTEAALQASEERYRLIAENTSDVIWLYDLKVDGFSYLSPGVHTLLGYRAEELIGRNMSMVQTPIDAEKVRQLLKTRLVEYAAGKRTRSSTVVEVDQTRKDGSIVPTEVVASVLADVEGRPTHVLGVSRDITERRRARQTLEKFNSELEQRVEQRTAELAARNGEIRALLDSIPDTVLLCDGSGAVISSHLPAGAGAAGWSAGGSRAPSPDPLLLEIAREMQALPRSGQQTLVQDFDRVVNNALVSIEARLTPAGPDRLLVLLRDISVRKQIERDVLANFEREKQLSEMKSQFISVASHEFRTPLAAAIGSLELLQRHASKLTDAKRRELFTRAQSSLGRLTEIMDDVLRIGRADSGRLKVNRMNVELGRLVQDVINQVAEGDRHQHTFAFEQSGGPDTAPADSNLLNHVLSNLVGNAARYSPAGTTISVTLVTDPRELTVVVADEGIGIPEAERERIFEAFTRGSNVGEIGGTGLGLNIVKRYTELMGGTIEILPTDRGAAFRVCVPCSSDLLQA
jgi:PAS domain S-box-containing protein